MKTEFLEHFESRRLPDESLDLLLDEAERALLEVESRPDEPGYRRNLDERDQGIGGLRRTLAELSDEIPGLHGDLEWISDRLREHGGFAGIKALESRPHVVDFVRISLEVFFRRYPHQSDYVSSATLFAWRPDLLPSPEEAYVACSDLLEVLRDRVS